MKRFLMIGVIGLAVSTAVFSQTYPSRPVVQRLNAEIGRALRDPEVQNNFRTGGVEATWMGPQELAAFMPAEYEKWGRVVRETGATVN